MITAYVAASPGFVVGEGPDLVLVFEGPNSNVWTGMHREQIERFHATLTDADIGRIVHFTDDGEVIVTVRAPEEALPPPFRPPPLICACVHGACCKVGRCLIDFTDEQIETLLALPRPPR